jgi:O-antigen/teichoic acid export membrane protein
LNDRLSSDPAGPPATSGGPGHAAAGVESNSAPGAAQEIGREAKAAVRNAGWLMVQRVLHVLAGLSFALVVPRLMGPDAFGRLAFMTSIALWFALFSGMSSAQVMGRFVPQLRLEPDGEGVRKFFGNLLVVRVFNGFFAAGFYFLLTGLLFRDLDRVAVAIVAGSVFFRTAGRLVFALFLGLNQAARWGAGDLVRRWLSLTFLVPGFYFAGLRGACVGLLITEFAVLVFGLKLAWQYFSPRHLRLDWTYIAPFLRFGLYFFAANLLQTVSLRSGELLVRVVTGDYVQVGLFGVAHRIYLTATEAMWNLSMAFAPLLTMMVVQSREVEAKRWIERLLKLSAVTGALVVHGVLLLGNNLVPFALGSSYREVAVILVPLSVALLAFGVSSVSRMLALTYDSPRVAVIAAAIHLAVFWALGWPLVISRGSHGASVAVLAASVLSMAFFVWSMRRVVSYPLRSWLLPILVAALFLPLTFLRSSVLVNVSLYAVFVVAYCVTLFRLKVITTGELVAVRDAILRSGRRSESAVPA